MVKFSRSEFFPSNLSPGTPPPAWGLKKGPRAPTPPKQFFGGQDNSTAPYPAPVPQRSCVRDVPPRESVKGHVVACTKGSGACKPNQFTVLEQLTTIIIAMKVAVAT